MNTVLPSIALAVTLLFASSAFAMPQATAAKPAAAPAKGGSIASGVERAAG